MTVVVWVGLLRTKNIAQSTKTKKNVSRREIYINVFSAKPGENKNLYANSSSTRHASPPPPPPSTKSNGRPLFKMADAYCDSLVINIKNMFFASAPTPAMIDLVPREFWVFFKMAVS